MAANSSELKQLRVGSVARDRFLATYGQQALLEHDRAYKAQQDAKKAAKRAIPTTRTTRGRPGTATKAQQDEVKKMVADKNFKSQIPLPYAASSSGKSKKAAKVVPNEAAIKKTQVARATKKIAKQIEKDAAAAAKKTEKVVKEDNTVKMITFVDAKKTRKHRAAKSKARVEGVGSAPRRASSKHSKPAPKSAPRRSSAPSTAAEKQASKAARKAKKELDDADRILKRIEKDAAVAAKKAERAERAAERAAAKANAPPKVRKEKAPRKYASRAHYHAARAEEKKIRQGYILEVRIFRHANKMVEYQHLHRAAERVLSKPAYEIFLEQERAKIRRRKN